MRIVSSDLGSSFAAEERYTCTAPLPMLIRFAARSFFSPPGSPARLNKEVRLCAAHRCSQTPAQLPLQLAAAATGCQAYQGIKADCKGEQHPCRTVTLDFPVKCW